jgi:hypothetical protein
MASNPHSRHRRSVLAVLFCSLTIGAAAQDVPPAPISSAPALQAKAAGSARHLDEAAAVMKTVSDSSLNSDGRKRLAELQRHFAELVESYQKSPDAFADPAVGSEGDDADNNEASADANWKEMFTLVERDLSGILGAGPALPAGSPANASPVIAVTTRGGAVAGTTGQLPQTATATPNAQATPNTQATPATPTAGAETPAPTAGAVATTGATTSIGTINGGLVAGAIGVKNLDPEVRRQLEEFRLHVELFFAATTMNLEGETAR